METKLFTPNLIVLYSINVAISESFYEKLLAKSPIAKFEGFSVFQLTKDVQLGLQDASLILPKSGATFGGFELCLSDISKNEVDELASKWKSENFKFIMEPQMVEFGYVAVIEDPDGHRIRICATDTSGIPDRQTME